MINLISKYFKKYKKNNFLLSEIKKIAEERKIDKIFNSILNYSETSELRYVGGIVRKIIKNEKVDDIDLSTNLTPKEVCEALKKNNIRYFESGIEHGTITAKIGENKFEITTLRKDVSTDGRHAKVEYSKDWLDDASRRDFTFNSIYSDYDGNLYDPFNGKIDLLSGKVKFIGDPEKRIKEDYLRIIRYIRFHLNYSKIKHNIELKKIIKQNIDGISKISSERLLDELKKIILSEGFTNINSDSFAEEIIKLIYPELINLNVFKNCNDFLKQIIKEKDILFLISLMIIDDTDNSEYFIFKYNISNEDKKKIRFLNNIFIKKLDKEFFNEKNLWKMFYYHGKNYLNDMIDLKIILNKKTDQKLIKLKDFFNKQDIPILEIKAKTLIDKYNFKEGKELGAKLKEIEDFWIKNSFKISDKELNKIINN